MNVPTSHLTGTATWAVATRRLTAPLTPDLRDQELYRADRIRKPKSFRTQKNRHGEYSFASIQKLVWSESMLEAASLCRLDYGGTVQAIASQPMRLDVGDFQHFPDYLALHNDGSQWLYDVKLARAIDADTRRQFEVTAEICKQIGWHYRVITELPDQAAVNLSTLYEHRLPSLTIDPAAVDMLVAQFEQGWTIADAIDALPFAPASYARARVLHLLWQRVFFVDLGSQLSDATKLHLTHPKEALNVAP